MVNDNIAKTNLSIGILFGIIFFIMGLVFGVTDNDWIAGLQTGSIMGMIMMLCGLTLYWINKLDALRGQQE